MSYYIELNGVSLGQKASTTEAYTIKATVAVEAAIAERPIAALAVRVPPAATLSPQDFDEITIDYPVQPYRSWAERHAALVAYWRFDEAAVTLAVDSEGSTPLTYAGGNDLQHRAYRQETSAVPYGAAPEWGHTSGAGLTGSLPTGIDPEWTIAGFVRMESGSAGDRDVWNAGTGSRRFRINSNGSIDCRFGSGSLTAPAGTIGDDTWHHVALTRTGSARELWVDGESVDSQSGGGSTLNGRTFAMAVAIGRQRRQRRARRVGHLVGSYRRSGAIRPQGGLQGLRGLRLRPDGQHGPGAG